MTILFILNYINYHNIDNDELSSLVYNQYIDPIIEQQIIDDLAKQIPKLGYNEKILMKIHNLLVISKVRH